MKILFFIRGKANPNRANGVNQVVYELVRTMTTFGHEVHVVGLSTGNNVEYEKVARGNFEVEVYKSFLGACFDRIKALIKECDVVHLHAVWDYRNVQIGKYCKKANKPYVVTAHGGYVRQAMLKASYLKKLFFHKLFSKNLYESAAFIHALTYEESTEILNMCPKSNVKVVPNGVNYRLYQNICYQARNNDIITIGFLGRVSKEKNLHSLINAISLLPNDLATKINLKIIGPYDSNDSYFKKLKQLVDDHKLSNIVYFVGSKFSDEKIDSLLQLDLYVHPSLIEGFSISILEILSLGIPSIITRTSNMSYYYNSNSFLMAEPTANDLARAIAEMISHRNEWNVFSSNARKLVQQHLTWESVTSQLCQEYSNIIQ